LIEKLATDQGYVQARTQDEKQGMHPPTSPRHKLVVLFGGIFLSLLIVLAIRIGVSVSHQCSKHATVVDITIHVSGNGISAWTFHIITCRPTELESCSDALKMQKVS